MYEEYSLKDKCYAIIEWAKYRKNFDISFVESVLEYEEERGETTIAQENAIDHIISKWRIKISKYLE